MTPTRAPIITSLLDLDLYKLTMGQAMLHQQPSNTAEYRFHCRSTPQYPLHLLKADIDMQLDLLCELSMTPQELAYVAGLRFIKPDFVAFLRIFRFHRPYIETAIVGDVLGITAKGPQVHVMAFETFVLAIVNELYFRRFDPATAVPTGRARLLGKIATLRTRLASARKQHPFELFDFGTRRRYSRVWHAEVVQTLQREIPEYFKGTSNVLLAMQTGLTPIGTMAHEWLQTFQATAGVQLRYSQQAALQAWVDEYRGDLGIALTDVISMSAFLRDFDRYFTTLFDGMRHDSGDPMDWARQALAHYQKYRVDPHTKRLVFSDGLDIPKCLDLYEELGDVVQTGFGVGTNLTNDMGLQPISIVMKLVRCNDQPVAKLSDSPGKTLCDDQGFVGYLRSVFSDSASH